MSVKRQAGFSVAELLVALVITLIVLATALQAFNEATRANEGATLMAEMNQNLRAGMNLMLRDLLRAGGGIPTGGIPVPSGAGVLLINRPSPLGVAYTWPAGTVAIPALTPGAGLGPVSPPPPAPGGIATDMITILFADNILTINQVPLAGVAPDGSSMTVQNPPLGVAIAGVNNAIQPGDLILFSNTNGNALQQVTGVNGQVVTFAAGDFFNLNQRGAPGGTIMCLANVGAGNPNDCSTYNGGFPPTTATRIWMVTYYIDNTTDPRSPRLIRQVNFNPARAMAEGIENLQLSYDLVDGVTNPTNVKTPLAPNSPNQIRKANLFLAARSSKVFSGSGQFFRNNLATQVSIRSLSFVDRYR